jgi:hypothetical protein
VDEDLQGGGSVPLRGQTQCLVVPRRGQVKAQFPDVLIERVIEETGRREQRSRDLPAALMARYVLALALFPSDGYDEVMRQSSWLMTGLRMVVVR